MVDAQDPALQSTPRNALKRQEPLPFLSLHLPFSHAHQQGPCPGFLESGANRRFSLVLTSLFTGENPAPFLDVHTAARCLLPGQILTL